MTRPSPLPRTAARPVRGWRAAAPRQRPTRCRNGSQSRRWGLGWRWARQRRAPLSATCTSCGSGRSPQARSRPAACAGPPASTAGWGRRARRPTVSKGRPCPGRLFFRGAEPPVWGALKRRVRRVRGLWEGFGSARRAAGEGARAPARERVPAGLGGPWPASGGDRDCDSYLAPWSPASRSLG